MTPNQQILAVVPVHAFCWLSKLLFGKNKVVKKKQSHQLLIIKINIGIKSKKYGL